MDKVISRSNSSQFLRVYEGVRIGLSITWGRLLQKRNFTLFNIQRDVERGDWSGWVSFQQKEKKFNIFAGKVRSFKERYFLARPKSEEALNNLLWPALTPRADGVEAHARVPYFPLEWCGDHYKFKQNDYSCSLTRLTEEERAARDKFWAYVRAFTPTILACVDGKKISTSRLIETCDLVLAGNPMDLLGILSSVFLPFFFFSC